MRSRLHGRIFIVIYIIFSKASPLLPLSQGAFVFFPENLKKDRAAFRRVLHSLH